MSITELNGALEHQALIKQLSSLVARNPPCVKDAVSLFLSGLCLQERCTLCIAALSPHIPPVRWKASVVIPAPLEFMALGWREPGGWNPRITTKLLLIGLTFSLSMLTQCLKVCFGEHMYLNPPNYPPPRSLVPFDFPWHVGTMGLLELMRMCSVNLSQPNLNLSEKWLQRHWIWKHFQRQKQKQPSEQSLQ